MSDFISKLVFLICAAFTLSIMAMGQGLEHGVEAYQADDYAAALPIFQDLADAGDDDAMWYLGKLYDNGLGVEQSDELAFEWFKRSADLGDPDSMWEVGLFYETGQGMAVDQKAAFRWYLQSAEGGRAAAMTEVGLRYETGNGVRKSLKNSFKWYLRAGEAGDALGQAYTGYAYEFGEGVRVSEDDAVYWYRNAAEQDHPQGLAWLGEMYESGTGVAQDISQARALYQQAAGLGSDYAADRLAALGTDQPESAYTPAVTDGDDCDYDLDLAAMKPDCQYGVALLMVRDFNAYDSAQPILEQLSDLFEHADAEHLLGDLYYQAEGWQARSTTKAFNWYLKAADHGHPEAQAVIGGVYLVGEMGAEKDETLGLDYIKKAARQGHTRSQDFLTSQAIAW